MSSSISADIDCAIAKSINSSVGTQFGNDGGSLLDHACLFIDCQTTGASPASGGNLLEVAWCTGSASGLTGSEIISHLISQPDQESIPYRIQSLTGITDDAMCDAISYDELVQKLLGDDKTLSGPQLCVIHYARFETPFLNELTAVYGDGKEFPYQLICTFEIARRLYPNLPSRGIRALGGFLGIDLEEMKRAPSHVGATRVIWKHLVERLGEVGITTVDQLQEFLSNKAERRTGKLEYKLEPLKRLELPNCPGVYRMLSQNGRVLYVGKATSLKSRVNSHFRGRKNKTSKSKELLTQVADIQVTECGSPLEAALLETDEIKKFDPPYNISLKQRSRSLLFASRDFLSFSEQQDEVHSVGPMPNPRALDALLRLNATINSGIVDPLILFEEIPMEDLVEGLDIFLERHSIDSEEGMTPRILVAIGLNLFRITRKLMRKLALELALAKAIGSEENKTSGEHDGLVVSTALTESVLADALNDESENRLAEIGRSLIESEEEYDAEFEEDDELTPEEIANRIESLLIGIARTYLISKEMTCLLNATLSFDYKSSSRDLVIRNGQIVIGTASSSSSSLEIAHYSPARSTESWSDLNVCDYDRMRVLLTEITRMRSNCMRMEVQPQLAILSRW